MSLAPASRTQSVPAQLFRLDQLDSDIEGHEAALSELRRRQQNNPEMHAAEAQLAQLRAEDKRLGAEQRARESDLADLETRIKRDNTRMYGGQIVDSRELESIERELQHHRERRDALEEQVLGLMERLEGLQSEIEAQDRKASSLRERWETDQPEMERRLQQLQSELELLRTERDALASSLDPRSLSLYTRLRAQSGHAVSNVSDGVCQWCRVNLPPKDIQHARTVLVTCTNCARILYIGS
jgi:predicted  nucleic acid-binding Zn-ribbon protein